MVAGNEIGGAETFCLDAIKALHEAGIEQRVICRPHRNYIEVFENRSIKFDILHYNKFEKFGKASKVIGEAISEFKPDLIHSWMSRASSFVPKNIPVPVLGWFGGYYDLKRYRNCDYFGGVTKDIVRHIIERSSKPHRAYLLHTFGTLEDNPPVDRRTLSTPEQAPVALLLSRMHKKKGVDTLLHAASRLKDVYFWLAGDGPEIEKYKDLARRLNLGDRVRFLGWRTDRAALLKAADICVLPSRYEPFGTVIAEAWASGVPLVATRAAGARQYVTHEHDGLLCDIDDVDGLTRQIGIAATDDGVRRKLMENGRNTYRAFFSREKVVDAFIETYERIMEVGKGVETSVNVAEIDDDTDVKRRVDNASRSCFGGLPDVAVDKSCLAGLAQLKGPDPAGMDACVDAAFLQASGLHDFIRSKSRVEVWRRPELDTAIRNACDSLQHDEAYRNFVSAYSEASRQ
ncbi:glycosyltransferase [Inquilinus sp. CAU 1745]